ncbi:MULTISPECIES: hypothetical protein [unclassified Streptomyces]|uniref:hypothetical protein n=1 Tax=unclassified Streptomyces TaxID=2593676 RepID=UPI0033B62453
METRTPATRQRRPAAAVVAAVTLVDPPEPGDRVALDAILREGDAVVLGFDPGQMSVVDEDGDVAQERVEPCCTATARGLDGREISWTTGDTMADALLRLWRPAAHLYSSEPPLCTAATQPR